MHCLTSQGNWELRIDYQLKNGTKSYLHYNKFAIGSAEDKYRLNISGFDNIGLNDPFDTFGQTQNGMKFTSRDRDNDLYNGINCAHYDGAWWHHSCGFIRLNENHSSWLIHLNAEHHAMLFIEMKIRLQGCLQ